MARGHTGPSSRAAREIVHKLSDDTLRKLATIRALWFAVHNEPDKTLRDLGVEFYEAVGDVLEGKAFEDLELVHIDPKRVIPFLKEG